MLMMSKHPNPNSITLRTEEKIESGQRPSCKILVKQSVSENSMNLWGCDKTLTSDSHCHNIVATLC